MKHFNLTKDRSNAAVMPGQAEKQIIRRMDISFALYLLFFIINVITGLFMNCITVEDEFLPATAAAVMLGKNWSGVMPQFSSLGQLVQGILYLPAMLLFNNPVLQYKFYMIISAAVYALVAPCAYTMTSRLGITEIWQRVIISSVCTLSPVVISGSHFLSAQPMCIVIVWIVALILLKSDTAEDKKSGRRFFSATTAGVLCAVAYFINRAMILLPFIITGYCIYIYFVHKRRPLFLAVFVISFAVLFTADMLLSKLLTDIPFIAFDGGVMASFGNAFSLAAENPGLFFSHLGGRVYTFIVSSWGMTTGAIAFMTVAAASYCRRKSKNYEQFYGENYALNSIFFLLTTLLIPVGALLSVADEIKGQESFLASDDTAMIITPLIFMFLVYIFRYGITYVRLMAVIATTGLLSFASIMLCKASVITLDSLNTVEAAGISPLKLDFLSSAPFDSDGMVYPVFFIFTAYAALIPVVCCAKNHAKYITAFACAGLLTFSAVYTYGDTVFVHAAKSVKNSESIDSISSYITKEGAEPPLITVCGENRNLAMGIQYFNQDREVIYTEDKNSLPDNCYLITENDIVPYGYCVLIGRTDGINIYAYGSDTIMWNEDTHDNITQTAR